MPTSRPPSITIIWFQKSYLICFIRITQCHYPPSPPIEWPTMTWQYFHRLANSGASDTKTRFPQSMRRRMFTSPQWKSPNWIDWLQKLIIQLVKKKKLLNVILRLRNYGNWIQQSDLSIKLVDFCGLHASKSFENYDELPMNYRINHTESEKLVSPLCLGYYACVTTCFVKHFIPCLFLKIVFYFPLFSNHPLILKVQCNRFISIFNHFWTTSTLLW